MVHLSNTFKYISYFRRAGHQIGRKVGDMLEVLTYAALYNNEDLNSRLVLEPKLLGFSGAGHKVEFAITAKQHMPLEEIYLKPEDTIGFIECKKVGVEQTVNSGFKKAHKPYDNNSFLIPYEKEFAISFAPRGHSSFSYTVIVHKSMEIEVKINNKVLLKEPLASGQHRLIFTLSTDYLTSEVIGNSGSLREKDYSLANCRILEIFAAQENGVTGILNDCLCGPQTPEKAKQSSFVALDVRKRRFGSFDKRPNERECVSMLVLTEYSHWEEKSKNMIVSCIDTNLVVDDALIIEAFEEFEKDFGEDFYSKITKDSFLNDEKVRAITARVLDKHDYKIFQDIHDGVYKKILFNNGQLIVSD